MTESEALAYVIASAAALQVPMDAARAQRVATHLQRTAGMAELLWAHPLQVEDEPAEVYCPAPPAPATVEILPPAEPAVDAVRN